MDPQRIFCDNLDCPARGQAAKGNISVHSQKEQRYKCHVCGQTASVRRGTPLYRCHSDPQVVGWVVSLVDHGCPIPAIEATFGFQRRTIRGWVEKAGAHCQAIHHHLVAVPQDLGQVQADEIRVKMQKAIAWLAMAMAVPTRLWLGGVLSLHRDKNLIRALMALVRCCALPRPLLIAIDGFSSYVEVIRTTFRSAVRVHRVGRPRLVLWAELVLGQVVKHQKKHRLVCVVRRLVVGTQEQLAGLIAATQGKGVLNTSFIERLNATFRSCLFALVRRTRHLARRTQTLDSGMYLIGTVYNFCSFHDSLTHEGTKRTPAMAAGITDHGWSVGELLLYRVPPPRWLPPKRRGRKSKEMQALIERWVT